MNLFIIYFYNMKKKLIVIISIILLLIVLIVLIVGILIFMKNKNDNIVNTADNNTSTTNGSGGGQNRVKLSSVKGKIFNITDNTLIIDTDTNEGQKIVILSDTSTITKNTEANISDLAVAQNVLISGDLKDTTISAKSITIVPARNRRSSSSSSDQSSNGQSQQNSIPGQGGNGGGFQNLFDKNTFNGKILTISDKQIVIQSFNNTQYNVNFQTSTLFKKQISGTKDDIKKDINILIIGKADSSGTVTARNISIL